jgi:hypothetical protein
VTGAPEKGEFFESWSMTNAKIEERNDTVYKWGIRIAVVILAVVVGYMWFVNIPALF